MAHKVIQDFLEEYRQKSAVEMGLGADATWDAILQASNQAYYSVRQKILQDFKTIDEALRDDSFDKPLKSDFFVPKVAFLFLQHDIFDPHHMESPENQEAALAAHRYMNEVWNMFNCPSPYLSFFEINITKICEFFIDFAQTYTWYYNTPSGEKDGTNYPSTIEELIDQKSNKPIFEKRYDIILYSGKLKPITSDEFLKLPDGTLIVVNAFKMGYPLGLDSTGLWLGNLAHLPDKGEEFVFGNRYSTKGSPNSYPGKGTLFLDGTHYYLVKPHTHAQIYTSDENIYSLQNPRRIIE
jgi:hypothetical protein